MILRCPQCKNQFKPMKFQTADDGSQMVECLTCHHVFKMPASKEDTQHSQMTTSASEPPDSEAFEFLDSASPGMKYPAPGGEDPILEQQELKEPKIAEPEGISVSDSSKQTILIVDDTEFFRRVLSDLFMDNNYNVMTAVDGAEALSKIKKEREHIHLLLLDLQLPKMNGFEVLDNLHRSGISEQLPILIITGIHQKPEEVKLVKELGATGFVSKANPPEYFLFRVDQILNPSKAVWVEPKQDDHDL